MGKVIGIDLGTTNSVAACVNDARHTEIVRDAVGNVLVPSLVLFDDERVLVGEEAKLKGAGQGDRLASRAKRFMGQETCIAAPCRPPLGRRCGAGYG